MSRYFLHFHMAEVTFPDQEGVELTGVDFLTVKDWARFIFSAFEGNDEVEFAGARFEVADELGRVVAVVPIGKQVRNGIAYLAWPIFIGSLVLRSLGEMLY